MRSYEPAEFLSSLVSDRLGDPTDLSVHGLVKPSDDGDESALMFTTSLGCEKWIPIPVSSISSVRHIRNVTCKDHEHPLVRLALVEPAEGDGTGILFMRLFRFAQAATVKAVRGGSAPAGGDCEVFTFDDEPFVCCPPASGSGPWECLTML